MNIKVLWNKNDKIALCLSGGVDSVVLFHKLISEYRDSYKELVIFHINHGLRKESDEEEEFITNLAAEHNVKIYKKSLHLSEMKKQSHTSEEMLARKLRYKAFYEMAKTTKVNCILTAHHKNDCVENIMMRLLSGRSIDYTLSIEEEIEMQGMTVYRPLLAVLKKELENYADKHGIKYYVDSSNFNTDYTRNYIRHNIIPLLEKVNEASFDNLINFSNYYKDVNDTLKIKSLNGIDSLTTYKDENKVVLNFNELIKLSDAEIYYILSNIIAEYFNVYNVKQKAIFNVIEDLKTNFRNKSYDIKNNLKIVKEYGDIYIHKIEKKCYNDRIEIIIDKLEEENFYEFYQYNISITKNNENSEIGFNEEDLPIVITTKKDGDVIKRGGFTKKLARIFIDEKIPKSKRETLPVIKNKEGRIIGVLGIKSKVKAKYDYYIQMKGK